MTAKIKEQISAIRETGETNMLDVKEVIQIANRDKYFELMNYLVKNKQEYSRFTISGEEVSDGEVRSEH